MLVDQDAFSSSQILSKIWLVETLEDTLRYKGLNDPLKILILGGWYGITNLLLRTRKNIKIDSVLCIDIDSSACEIASKVNETWVWQNQFESLVYNANDYLYNDYDVVINTSVEHMESKQWFDNIPKNTVVALQSNDMEHNDHFNTHSSLDEFKEDYKTLNLDYEGVKMFQYKDHNFQRFMIIGTK